MHITTPVRPSLVPAYKRTTSRTRTPRGSGIAGSERICGVVSCSAGDKRAQPCVRRSMRVHNPLEVETIFGGNDRCRDLNPGARRKEAKHLIKAVDDLIRQGG